MYIMSPLFYFYLTERKEHATSSTGESPLPLNDEVLEQELNLKPVVPPSRLEPLLTSQQVDLGCKQVTEVAGEAFVKLYMSDCVQIFDDLLTVFHPTPTNQYLTLTLFGTILNHKFTRHVLHLGILMEIN